MNSIKEYRKNLLDVTEKLQNNVDYFSNFGKAYIPVKIRGYLENVLAELDRIDSLVETIDEEE